MALYLAPDAVFNALSGVLLVVLGFYIFSVRPRTRSSVALGAFSIIFGANWVPENLLPLDHALRSVPSVNLTMSGMWAASAALLVLVALWVPRPLAASERRLLVWPVITGLVWPLTGLLVLWRLGIQAFIEEYLGRSFLSWPIAIFGFIAFTAMVSAFLFMLALLAERWGATSVGDPERHRIVLLAGALTFYPLTFLGGMILFVPLAMPAVVLSVSLLVSRWLANGARERGEGARTCRNMALLAPAVALAGLSFDLFFAYPPPGGGPHYGVSRALAVFVLAYAILRHQLLGIDVKVRWTIRQSTVAAVFVTVFFVVSELAQQFLGETLGSSYVGIIAAGALVFAIAPLQRVAERVADTALPGVKSLEEMDDDDRLNLYREQLRMAWADGVVSADERRLLEVTRERLDIPAEEALRLERDTAP